MKNKNTLKKKDIFLISGILLVAVISYFLIYNPFNIGDGNKEIGNTVVVRINGEKVAVYSLDENSEYVLNNGTHILVIENGEAYLKETGCPDHYCEKQGKISYNNQTLTCLPFKLTVTVSNDKQPSVDLVS